MTADPPTSGATVPTGVQLTALDPAFREDPYPVLARVRETEPVHYDSVLKRWVLTRAEDIEAVLRDRSLSVDGRRAAEGTYMKMFMPPDDARAGAPSMLFSDPPYHTRLRSLVTKAFSAKAVEALAPHIRDIADGLLDAVGDAPEWDLVEAYAGPLPVIVIAEMLGVDPSDRNDFKRWSDISVMGFNPLLTEDQRALIDEAMGALNAYRFARSRRAAPHLAKT